MLPTTPPASFIISSARLFAFMGGSSALSMAQLPEAAEEGLGGWVGGWVMGYVEENEAVRMRCCGLGEGGWVEENEGV